MSIWPERPLCHGEESRLGPVVWRDPRSHRDETDPYAASFRTCGYCGSIHPGDLYDLLVGPSQVRIGGSDWKYGWPHKFYVEGIPNLAAGEPYVIYTTTGRPDNPDEWEEYTPSHNPNGGTSYRKVYSRSKCPETMGSKWYNEHFEDLSAEAFGLLQPIIAKHTGIIFSFVDADGRDTTAEDPTSRLHYSASYFGYQA